MKEYVVYAYFTGCQRIVVQADSEAEALDIAEETADPFDVGEWQLDDLEIL